MGAVPASNGRQIASTARGTRSISVSPINRGFTLIEILVTIAIAALLTVLTLPGFLKSVRNERLTAEANSFVVSLNYARNEAIKRDAPVAICANTRPPNPPACIGSSGAWSAGWLVVPLTLTALGLTPSYPALQSVPAMQTCNYVTPSNLSSTILSFSGDGRLSNTSLTTPSTPAVFYFCDVRGSTSARSVRVDVLGRVELFPKAGFEYVAGTGASPISASQCPTPCT